MAEAGRPSQAPAVMRWWGWGDPAQAPSLDPRTLSFLRERLGVSDRPRPPVALSAVRLSASAVPPRASKSLERMLPAGALRTCHAERVRHAAGRGYPDLVRLRSGEGLNAPDAVAYPASAEQLQALLDCLRENAIAVVPFGGGTSVVGGVEPLRGEHDAVISVDLAALSGAIKVDRQSLLVTALAGTAVAALEHHLSSRGLSLGHFPQSFEHVSLGGCAATRSAGQASSGYGRFMDMVEGLRMLTPTGPLIAKAFPSTAAGPELRQLAGGSEGTLGVIAELALRVRVRPQRERYEGVFFEDFASGCQALRELAQERMLPAVTRLSDQGETAVSMQLARSTGGLKHRLGTYYLRARGYEQGCLAIIGLHGSEDSVSRQRRRVLHVLRCHGGLPVGESPGRAWCAQRFSAPYLRDELMTHGVMVETLETATQWSNLGRLHQAVGAAISGELERLGTPGVVMCHLSHLYETGASLYFTWLARQHQGQEIEQWRAVKRAASQAIVDGGGTITHHHAVGRDHLPWIASELGDGGVAALRALKQQFDPTGIMNPGKLIP